MITYTAAITDFYLAYFDEDVISLYPDVFINGKNLYPQNVREISIVYSKINEQVYYDKKIDGVIQFVNNAKSEINDYDVIKFLRDRDIITAGRPLLIDLFGTCGETTKKLLTMSINLLGGDYDDDNCTATFAPEYWERFYAALEQNKDTVFNLLTGRVTGRNTRGAFTQGVFTQINKNVRR